MPFDNPQPPTDPIIAALGQMIIESINREANLRAQLIAAQAQTEARMNELTAALVRIKELTPVPAEAPSAT